MGNPSPRTMRFFGGKGSDKNLTQSGGGGGAPQDVLVMVPPAGTGGGAPQGVLMSMGVRVEVIACGDMGARTSISASANLDNLFTFSLGVTQIFSCEASSTSPNLTH